MASFFVAACGDDDDTTDAGTGGGGTTDTGNGGGNPTCTNADILTADDITCSGNACNVPAGAYTGEVAFEAANTYLLEGRTFIGDGTTDCSGNITIAAGTTIFGSSTTQGYLAIQPNSTINANGTAAAPIIFTSDAANPDRGDWGGIIISGNATVNCGGTGTTCQGEGDTGAYGGTNDADNSGTLRYVVVQYGGNQVNADDQLNGIAFQGVGNGTTIDYIQVHRSQDDGVEFFGGTVDAKHILLTGIGDDALDWAFGWRGRVQYVIIQAHPGDDDRGIEADNNEDDNTAMPVSSPIISNITIVGAGNSTGITLRRGTAAQIWNAVVTGWSTGFDVDNEATFNNIQAGSLVLANGMIFGNGSNFSDDEDEDDDGVADDLVTLSTQFTDEWPNNEVADPGLPAEATDISNPDFVPTGAATMGGAQPSDTFFDQDASFRGGVGAGAVWYDGWTSFP